jgi:hypothetical protein
MQQGSEQGPWNSTGISKGSLKLTGGVSPESTNADSVAPVAAKSPTTKVRTTCATAAGSV